MSNFTLNYGISRKTQPSPRALKEILNLQASVNRACSWSHERLALSTPKQANRGSFPFPYVRFGMAPFQPPATPDGFTAGSSAPSNDASASGTTRVRDSLYNAHVVLAFVMHASKLFPELLWFFSGEQFVLAGSLWIRSGVPEAQMDVLAKERRRVLELSNDPYATLPFAWAELKALEGIFTEDGSAGDIANLPEIQQLADWQQLESMSLSEAASLVVEHAAKEAVPAHA